MPDYRRTREEETQLYPQLVQFPSDPYISPNSLGGPGMGGAGNESGMGLAPQAAVEGVDQRLASIQQLGDQRRGLEDQLASMQGQPSTRLMTTGEMWQGLKDIGSSGLDLLGRGAKAILPTQEGWNEGAMRLQNANAIVNGGTPLWMMQQQHQAQMGQNEQLMALKRQQLSQQLQDHKMKRMEHLDNQALQLWTNPNMPISMRKKLSQQLGMQGSVLATNLARLGDEEIVSELESLREFIPGPKLDQAMQIMKTPNADLTPVEQLIQMGRERKKTFGEAKTASERFQELQSMRDSGQLTENHPYYQEYAKSADEMIKRKQDALERDMKLEQMGLTKKKVEQEYQMNQLMPQVSPGIPMPGGKTGTYVVDPQTMQRELIQGDKPPAMSVTNKIDMKTSESLAKPIGEIAQASHAKAMGAVQTVGTVNRIASALDSKELNIGPTATIRSEINRYATLFGIEGKNTSERLANTRSVIKGLAELALAGRGQLKGQGQVSDFEGKLLREAESGNIDNFTRDELKSFIGVVDRVARNNYKQHQDLIKTMMENPEDGRIAKFYKAPPLDEPYSTKSLTKSGSIKSLPEGSKQIGTSNGKPVYRDSSGKKWIGE